MPAKTQAPKARHEDPNRKYGVATLLRVPLRVRAAWDRKRRREGFPSRQAHFRALIKTYLGDEYPK